MNWKESIEVMKGKRIEGIEFDKRRRMPGIRFCNILFDLDDDQFIVKSIVFADGTKLELDSNDIIYARLAKIKETRYQVSSGPGYFVEFNEQDHPMMNTDPMEAAMLSNIEAAKVTAKMEEQGYDAEVIKISLVEDKPMILFIKQMVAMFRRAREICRDGKEYVEYCKELDKWNIPHKEDLIKLPEQGEIVISQETIRAIEEAKEMVRKSTGKAPTIFCVDGIEMSREQMLVYLRAEAKRTKVYGGAHKHDTDT